ncbi:hypothetical protein CMsap09_06260 [Clavibacter michiganensis]|uniref:Uncharacterized protein n=1 Tax=Clavibacter michiganensis TaxID=28447 RepID=A0A251XSP7_9MICO|nr:hypothetical protein CMsap09_06260 [Clavibacter michiganensis]
MSSLPDFSCSTVRSRCACATSPEIAAAAYPRARSFSASVSVSFLVRTNTIMPSKFSTSRMRVRASTFWGYDTMRYRCVVFAEVVVLFLTVISSGSCRYLPEMRRICAGIVAENSAICFDLGVSARIVSTSSAKPIFSISSASSSTRNFSCDRSRVPLSRWSMMRPGVPTTTCTPRRSADSCTP